jgi:hypothetical protein
MSNRFTMVAALFIACVMGLFSAQAAAAEQKSASGKDRLFEMRIYTAQPGKLDALNARFRNHTNRLFEKHGMTLVGYWVPTDGEKSKNTLIYILAYPDREAREKAWKAFGSDPEWQKARTESEKDGKLVEKVESTHMSPTDYSAIK